MINSEKLDWKKVWINNGSKSSSDLKVLNGHDKTSIDSEYVVHNITELFDVVSDTKVLEVGCGAGMLAQHFKCSYVGIDYSHTLIDKHKKILGNEVYVCEANELIFEDCEIPSSYLLGEEGGGLVHMMRNLEIERLALAAMSLGIADRCMELMLEYGHQRKAFNQPAT